LFRASSRETAVLETTSSQAGRSSSTGEAGMAEFYYSFSSVCNRRFLWRVIFRPGAAEPGVRAPG